MVLLEATPRGLDAEVIGRAIAAQPGVVEVHDLHVWQITSGFPSLSAHVLVREGDDCHGIRRATEHMLARAIRDHAHDAAGRSRAHVRAPHDLAGHALMSDADERTHRRVTRSVLLPLAEIELRVSRSSGPGGQHANTSETRVEAVFDVEASTALTANQKHRVVARVGAGAARGRAGRAEPAPQPRARDRPAGRAACRGPSRRAQARADEAVPRRARAAARGEEAARRRRSGCAGSTTVSSPVSELEPERLRPLLRGAFAEQYLYAVETGSTQDVLRDGDHPHGTVALAEHQTAGRGRSGRSWEDAPATNLLFSLLLEPPAGAPLPELSLVAGLAVASALEREAMVPALVKWPNDVLIDGGKVAGILLEATGRRIVCGIGINVNQVRGRPTADTRASRPSRSGSRRGVGSTGQPSSSRCWPSSSIGTQQWLEVGLAGLADDLERRNALRGRRVIVGGSRNGTADAIAADGRLTVVLDDGETTLVGSGEVRSPAA